MFDRFFEAEKGKPVPPSPLVARSSLSSSRPSPISPRLLRLAPSRLNPSPPEKAFAHPRCAELCQRNAPFSRNHSPVSSFSQIFLLSLWLTIS